MRILGIDPGTQYLGLGLIEASPGRVAYRAHKLITTRPQATLAEKLAHLDAELTQALLDYEPEQVAVEAVFHAQFARSALILAHARGVALACAGRRGLPVFEYPPSSIKRAVGVSGRAAKESVESMVRVILKIPALERADCADALACALCHAQHVPLQGAQAPKSRTSYEIVRRS